MKPYRTRVHVADTDSTGVLYFTALQRFALEAFESFLIEQGFKLGEVFLPIVHAEADYTAPLKVWNEVEIQLCCSKIGKTSFTIESNLVGHGRVAIVHVCVDSDGNKMPITDALKQLLAQLS